MGGTKASPQELRNPQGHQSIKLCPDSVGDSVCGTGHVTGVSRACSLTGKMGPELPFLPNTQAAVTVIAVIRSAVLVDHVLCARYCCRRLVRPILTTTWNIESVLLSHLE